ncbi:uncharacterized protein ARMOST_18549 [Armillaria ostoyae]|uniref:Uncharacterized protein n=1 Tax=Armillaria ostoyae TaxID=47428 RepID=A0A284S279_ARMOS|nr:uncharacterized protein ARMOST_18549 [Armillaria ostoyae]
MPAHSKFSVEEDAYILSDLLPDFLTGQKKRTVAWTTVSCREQFLAKFLPPPHLSASEVEIWKYQRIQWLQNKLNNLANKSKDKAPGQRKTQAEWYTKIHKNTPAFVMAVEAEKARVQDSEESVSTRVISGRGLQIRRRVAEALLETESPEVQEEIRRLVVEDAEQKGKGLVPGSPSYINRKILLLDRKMKELKQLADEVGWVFTILSGELIPGQIEPMSICLNHGVDDGVQFSSCYTQFEEHVAIPFRRFLCDIFTAEKCSAFVKEMATFHKMPETMDSEDDDNTAEKSVMDEGGDSAQAMPVLDALKQSFAMSQEQDLSTEFNHDARNEIAPAAVLVVEQPRMPNSGAVKAAGNEARSKGKSRTVKEGSQKNIIPPNQNTAVSSSSSEDLATSLTMVQGIQPSKTLLSNHCVPAATAGFTASKPQNLSTLTSEGLPHSFTSVKPSRPPFAPPQQPLYSQNYHPSLMESMVGPALYTTPGQTGHFANNGWQGPSWGPMNGGDQESSHMDLSIDLSNFDYSDLFKDLMGQEPALWSDLDNRLDLSLPLNDQVPFISNNQALGAGVQSLESNHAASQSRSVATPGWGDLEMGGLASWWRTNSGEGNPEAGRAEDVESDAAERVLEKRSMRFCGPLTMCQAGSAVEDALGKEFEHCMDKWKEVELCLSVLEGKLSTSGRPQVLPGLLGKKLSLDLPKLAPDVQDKLIEETLHWWNGLQDESRQSEIPGELPVPEYGCDMRKIRKKGDWGIFQVIYLVRWWGILVKDSNSNQKKDLWKAFLIDVTCCLKAMMERSGVGRGVKRGKIIVKCTKTS